MKEQILGLAREHLPLARPFLPHGVALVLFAVIGWTSGSLYAAKAVDNPDLKETWSLPAWKPYRAGPEKAKFAELDIWDGQKDGAAKPKQDAGPTKSWRLVGTVRSGKNYTAVVQIASEERIQRVKQGDLLPNGEKVLDVGNGSLRIDDNGNSQEIKLFQPDDQQEKK